MKAWRPPLDLLMHAGLFATIAAIALAWAPRVGAKAAGGRGALLWDERAGSLVSVRFEHGERTLVIERRRDPGGDYLWARGGDGEYLAGAAGDALFRELERPRAVRDLGVVDAAMKTTYRLDAPSGRLALALAGGDRELLVGDAGLGVRYVLEPKSGHAWAVREDLFAPLESDAALVEPRIHLFAAEEAAHVAITTSGGAATLVRFGSGGWALAETPDQQAHSLENLLMRLDRLVIAGYAAAQPASQLERLARVDYSRKDGTPLGFLELYVGAAPEGGKRYFLHSELTRVLVELAPGQGEQLARDIADVVARP